MGLLIESTHRNLDENEKKIIKNQTIEVIKTIPSLALFLLPGGSILLPVILRFIPSLLPSSFNENK
jgi:ABC-type proline/glycine betaine transport system permease subunit